MIGHNRFILYYNRVTLFTA